mmetsp:Transcript_51887/g.150750  ORF Transcript_51887/g.150750 Transcript_51887/m.150750 type:complete len:225 (+) Transcript_51887:845-1519(+)
MSVPPHQGLEEVYLFDASFVSLKHLGQHGYVEVQKSLRLSHLLRMCQDEGKVPLRHGLLLVGPGESKDRAGGLWSDRVPQVAADRVPQRADSVVVRAGHERDHVLQPHVHEAACIDVSEQQPHRRRREGVGLHLRQGALPHAAEEHCAENGGPRGQHRPVSRHALALHDQCDILRGLVKEKAVAEVCRKAFQIPEGGAEARRGVVHPTRDAPGKPLPPPQPPAD